jgi:hypothetical protein
VCSEHVLGFRNEDFESMSLAIVEIGIGIEIIFELLIFLVFFPRFKLV